MIVIVDYGVGNLGSIANMFRKAGAAAVVSSDPDEIDGADRVVLPGVGSFDNCVDSLDASGLRPSVERAALDDGKPLLGICVGMQMLGKASEEGVRPGLGWIEAETVRFRPEGHAGLKVPHMGWNDVAVVRNNPLLDTEPKRFYFLHSYHVECASPDDVIAESSYAGEFTCAVRRGNIFGVQFHPEKSHRFGLQLFRDFAALEQ